MRTVRQGHRSQAAFNAERRRKVTPWCVRQQLPDHPDFHHIFATQNIPTPTQRSLPLKLPCDSHDTVIDRWPGTTPSHVSNPPNLRIFSASLPGGMIRTCLLTKRAFFCKVHGTGGSILMAPGAQSLSPLPRQCRFILPQQMVSITSLDHPEVRRYLTFHENKSLKQRSNRSAC